VITPATNPLAVHASLARLGRSLEWAGPSAWRFVLQNGTRVHARAALADWWFTITAPAPLGFAPDCSWELLGWNPALPGGVRIVPDDVGGFDLRLDAWLGAHGDGISRACASLLSAHSLVSKEARHIGAVPAPVPDDDTSPDWWPVVMEVPGVRSRPSGNGVRVDVDTSRGRVQADIASTAGGLRCWSELVRGPADPSCREAMASALLQASRSHRMARPAVRDIGGAPRLVVEAMSPVPAESPDVLIALGAVAGACESYGAEVRALADPALAAEYLQIHSGCAVIAGAHRHVSA
jgi:hypothetical protein